MRSSSAFCALVAASSLFACGTDTKATATDVDVHPAVAERIVSARVQDANDAAPAPAADVRDGEGSQRHQTGQVVSEAAMRQGGVFGGTVEGEAFLPTYNFFMRGTMAVPGDPEATIFVQTDNPALCQHLAVGTMPRNTTMFAVALIEEDGSAPHVGGTYVAPGDRGPDDEWIARAYFRRTDATCQVTPEPLGAEAVGGSAVLRTLSDGKRAALDFKFALDQGDAIYGAIQAEYCEAPALFANPEALMAEVDPAVCRD